MAITIVDQPYEFTPLRQRLIVRATSNNTGNTGFQYKVVVQVDATTVYTGYHPPNPVDALIVDIRPLIEEFIYLTGAPLLGQGQTVHSMSSTTNIYAAETTGSRGVDVTLTEAWLVGGVLTDDPDADGSETASMKCVWPASYQYEDGYRPNPSNDYAMDGTTARALTDRDYDTHVWDRAESLGFTVNNTQVFIPVFEEDFGVLSIPIASASDFSGNSIGNVTITIHKANGTTSSYTDTISSAADIAHFPVYPANINASGIAGLAGIKPSANLNWVALSVLFKSGGFAARSQNYVLYNAELYGQHDCRYPRVRVGWANSRGGWDYFNFIRKNEASVQVERRRFRQIPGNYATADGDTAFTLPSYSRGLTESKPVVQRFIDITSDWITEGEFELLKWLVVSQDVQIINNNGTVTPVVVENNDFTTRVYSGGRLFNQTMRLRLAHDLNV